MSKKGYSEKIIYYKNGQCKKYEVEGDIDFQIDRYGNITSNETPYNGYLTVKYDEEGNETFYQDKYSKRTYFETDEGKPPLPLKFIHDYTAYTYNVDGSLNVVERWADSEKSLDSRFPEGIMIQRGIIPDWDNLEFNKKKEDNEILDNGDIIIAFVKDKVRPCKDHTLMFKDLNKALDEYFPGIVKYMYECCNGIHWIDFIKGVYPFTKTRTVNMSTTHMDICTLGIEGVCFKKKED